MFGSDISSAPFSYFYLLTLMLDEKCTPFYCFGEKDLQLKQTKLQRTKT